MELKLDRPLLFFDIESTGLNIATDGIIELSFVKVMPEGANRWSRPGGSSPGTIATTA